MALFSLIWDILRGSRIDTTHTNNRRHARRETSGRSTRMVDDMARRCVVVVGVCDYMCVCVCVVVCVSVRFGVGLIAHGSYILLITRSDQIKSNRIGISEDKGIKQQKRIKRHDKRRSTITAQDGRSFKHERVDKRGADVSGQKRRDGLANDQKLTMSVCVGTSCKILYCERAPLIKRAPALCE